MVSENPSPEKTDPTDVAKNWMAAVIWDIAVTAKQYPRLKPIGPQGGWGEHGSTKRLSQRTSQKAD